MRPVQEEDAGQYEINLKDDQGRIFPATIDLGCRDRNENNFRHVECRITLKWSGGELQNIETDFFEAFCRIREQLAEQNLYPLCYGASRRVFVTGMGRDMGLGLKAYKIP